MSRTCLDCDHCCLDVTDSVAFCTRGHWSVDIHHANEHRALDQLAAAVRKAADCPDWRDRAVARPEPWRSPAPT